MRALYMVFLVLTIVGGLNWGLVAAFNFDLVAFLFGKMTGLSRLVYGLVGLSALGLFFLAYQQRTTYVPTRVA